MTAEANFPPPKIFERKITQGNVPPRQRRFSLKTIKVKIQDAYDDFRIAHLDGRNLTSVAKDWFEAHFQPRTPETNFFQKIAADYERTHGPLPRDHEGHLVLTLEQKQDMTNWYFSIHRRHS